MAWPTRWMVLAADGTARRYFASCGIRYRLVRRDALWLLLTESRCSQRRLLDRDAALPFLVAAPAISRWTISALAAWLPYARAEGGLGQTVTKCETPVDCWCRPLSRRSSRRGAPLQRHCSDCCGDLYSTLPRPHCAAAYRRCDGRCVRGECRAHRERRTPYGGRDHRRRIVIELTAVSAPSC